MNTIPNPTNVYREDAEDPLKVQVPLLSLLVEPRGCSEQYHIYAQEGEICAQGHETKSRPDEVGPQKPQ